MPALIHSTESGSYWTPNDLDSFRISLEQVNPCQFFGLQELPQPSVDQELLDNLGAEGMRKAINKELIGLLSLAMTHENAVDDFAVGLLRATGYVNGSRLGRMRVDLPLLIRGETRHAKTDACVVEYPQNNVLLLVREGRGLELSDQINAGVQLVAAAVAAFNENNAQRKALGRPALADKVIPGIVMVGTLPTFFKIPVTKSLSNHIRDGTYPLQETVVTFCNPPVPRQRSEGMEPLDNRREIFRSYEAFKAIVGI